MRTKSLHFCILSSILGVAACSADGGGVILPGAGGSVSPGSGGAFSTGGTATSTGGVSTVTGGSTFGTGGISPTGGSPNSSGGAASTGGSNSSGGFGPGTGGTPNNPTGGNSSGGAGPNTGGAMSRGGSTSTPTGGRMNSGGSPSSGGTSSGGASSGGAQATGGTTSPPTPGKKFVGNITTAGNNIDYSGKTFSKHWDQITPENAGKWGSVQSNGGANFNWSALDQIYDYTQKNNIIFKQHAFIWGAQQPSGSLTEAQVKNWISSFCKRYPNVKLIDVVNEPPPHTTPSYVNAIGGNANNSWTWITNAFKWARESCPNAILILNDYNNIEWEQDNSHFVDIVTTIQKAGAPIDAVGAQSHDLDYNGQAKSLADVKKFMENLHTKTGLPVYITELDLDTTDDQKQLQWYQQFFPYFYELEYVKGITIWGWFYGQTWSQAKNSGLVRNGTGRPAMTWLMQQLGRPAP